MQLSREHQSDRDAVRSGDSVLPSSIASKLRQRYRDNGVEWLLYHVIGRVLHRIGDKSFVVTRRLEIERGLPGLNTRSNNRKKWNAYDWGDGGEEWSPSSEWQEALISAFILPNIDAPADILEIGPGAGRWTSVLFQSASVLWLADIAERPLELCREALGSPENVNYILTDGATLTGIGPEEVDFVWSFDAFVHIAPSDQKSYIKDLAAVLRPGGKGVIHHSGTGGISGGWRSSMTSTLFVEFAELAGLRVTQQVDRWGPDGRYVVPVRGDSITTFVKPDQSRSQE